MFDAVHAARLPPSSWRLFEHVCTLEGLHVHRIDRHSVVSAALLAVGEVSVGLKAAEVASTRGQLKTVPREVGILGAPTLEFSRKERGVLKGCQVIYSSYFLFGEALSHATLHCLRGVRHNERSDEARSISVGAQYSNSFYHVVIARAPKPKEVFWRAQLITRAPTARRKRNKKQRSRP